MNSQKVLAEIESLPVEAQQEVVDFVDFLRLRYSAKPAKNATTSFIGMWKNREDLKDSAAAVRQLRESEWSR